ncbi:MAG: homocysteine S-methyltransferase family protein [Bacteroidales bacterium]|nr:homocysteine S-methyltransferase family protein [Bacteroidales bacterium]
MRTIKEKLKKNEVLVSDGAWGTFIHQKGLGSDECPESWNLTHPDDIYDVALSYVKAGSDMILTNSFGASPFKLAPYGLSDKTYEINKAASGISRRAARNDVIVLGSVGPTGKLLMMGDVTEKELFDGFSEQIKGLTVGGCDAVLIETMSDMDEARIAIRAAKSVTQKEVMCTFTFTLTPAGEYRTMMGASPAESVQMLLEEGVDVLGANCGNGTAGMIEIVRQIREVNREIPVLVHANAGMPELKDGESVFPETPSEMSSQIRDLILAGANIVGGCCGTTPGHIASIVKVVKG